MSDEKEPAGWLVGRTDENAHTQNTAFLQFCCCCFCCCISVIKRFLFMNHRCNKYDKPHVLYFVLRRTC